MDRRSCDRFWVSPRSNLDFGSSRTGCTLPGRLRRRQCGRGLGLVELHHQPELPARKCRCRVLQRGAQRFGGERRGVAAAGAGDLAPGGFTGGVQAGYDWQDGAFVFGGEADFGALDLGQSATAGSGFPFPFLGTSFVLTERMSTEWLATIRGRLGYTPLPQLLLYATGGIAFTDFRFSSSYADNAVSPLFPGGTGFGSRSGVSTGWTVGGGGEWMLHDGWSVRAEYLYVDFGSERIAVPVSNTPANAQLMFVDADLTAQLARAGLNYRY
jgi:outer membrane immunogenic protein